MAYLVLRDRRLEAKIAYVGPERAGKATSVSRLFDKTRGTESGALEERQTPAGRTLSFAWRPSVPDTLQDFQIEVTLVSVHGAASSDALRDVVTDADGLVLVLDADPAALERNRSFARHVQETVSLAVDREVPVVVQVNKCDLPDAMSTDALVRALDLAPWPHVRSSAREGEGVVEAAERAVAGVLELLKETNSMVEIDNASVPTEMRGPASKGEGNPLLTALRHVLETAIGRHMEGLEERLAARLERRLAASVERKLDELQRDVRQIEARIGAELARRDETLARESTLRAETLSEALGRIERMSSDVHAALETLTEELRRSKKRWFS